MSIRSLSIGRRRGGQNIHHFGSSLHGSSSTSSTAANATSAFARLTQLPQLITNLSEEEGNALSLLMAPLIGLVIAVPGIAMHRLSHNRLLTKPPIGGGTVSFHRPNQFLEPNWISQSGDLEFLVIARSARTGRVDIHRGEDVGDAQTRVAGRLLDVAVRNLVVRDRLAAPPGVRAWQTPARFAPIADEADAVAGEGDVLRSGGPLHVPPEEAGGTAQHGQTEDGRVQKEGGQGCDANLGVEVLHRGVIEIKHGDDFGRLFQIEEVVVPALVPCLDGEVGVGVVTIGDAVAIDCARRRGGADRRGRGEGCVFRHGCRIGRSARI